MIAEVLVLIAFLIENCTGVALIETYEESTIHSPAEGDSLIEQHVSSLEDFTHFDPTDAIFQEYDPPRHLETDPKAWKQSLPSFNKSFWECLKTVLLIQAVTSTVFELAAIFVVFLDFSTAEVCYNKVWNEMPKNVQHLRVIAQCVEAFLLQMWNLFCIWVIIPSSLIKELNILTHSLVAAFLDVIYRLCLQMYGIYRLSWMKPPLNALFGLVVLINHYRLSRHCYPNSFKDTLKLHFVITSQFTLGVPVWYLLVYKLVPLYVQQDEHVKLFIAALCPLLTVLPKAVSRVSAQSEILKGLMHPGKAYFLVAITYGISSVVFRAMQAELNSIGLFIALGIVHAFIDLLERITITMRDHIWEYLYRLVRRQRRRQPKYRSPRSRRLIADISIQIMMQEVTALVTALGFISVYRFIYSQKSLTNFEIITDFLVRAGIGLLIDVVFNVISLLIQTRVMNIAVNRVWKKKWRHHIVVNSLIVFICVLYFSEHLFKIAQDKYDSRGHSKLDKLNCSLPSFL
ncbi:uncharacterized protein LOC116288989 [Actinia tenebrosa]|uniref:Uncharacterized protein LOC116288989 n=1 Tax=Actinia tenebrosa TaxID=6105 RepID=A0A6P8HGL6_ACTTE|nr:uncharacterized protein LOC116288989 [Actinia tenebrosa]